MDKPDPLQQPVVKQDLVNLEAAVGLLSKRLTGIDYQMMSLVKCYDRIGSLVQQLVDAQVPPEPLAEPV